MVFVRPILLAPCSPRVFTAVLARSLPRLPTCFGLELRLLPRVNVLVKALSLLLFLGWFLTRSVHVSRCFCSSFVRVPVWFPSLSLILESSVISPSATVLSPLGAALVEPARGLLLHLLGQLGHALLHAGGHAAEEGVVAGPEVAGGVLDLTPRLLKLAADVGQRPPRLVQELLHPVRPLALPLAKLFSGPVRLGFLPPLFSPLRLAFSAALLSAAAGGGGGLGVAVEAVEGGGELAPQGGQSLRQPVLHLGDAGQQVGQVGEVSPSPRQVPAQDVVHQGRHVHLPAQELKAGAAVHRLLVLRPLRKVEAVPHVSPLALLCEISLKEGDVDWDGLRNPCAAFCFCNTELWLMGQSWHQRYPDNSKVRSIFVTKCRIICPFLQLKLPKQPILLHFLLWLVATNPHCVNLGCLIWIR